MCMSWNVIYRNSSSWGSVARPSSFHISRNWGKVSTKGFRCMLCIHTFAFCASASSVVSKAAVAKGSRCQEMVLSLRFAAVLSPIALFFPTTNLLHLLQTKLEMHCKTANHTYSSEREYTIFKWVLSSITRAIITDVRINAGISYWLPSVSNEFFGWDWGSWPLALL